MNKTDLDQIGELIEEKLEPINKKLDGIAEQLSEVSEDVSDIKETLEFHSKRITTIEGHLGITASTE